MELISLPMKAYKTCKTSAERKEKVLEMMDIVGLSRRLAYSYPHELDGGRRQRVGIATRAALGNTLTGY